MYSGNASISCGNRSLRRCTIRSSSPKQQDEVGHFEDRLDNPGDPVELTAAYNLPDTVHHNAFLRSVYKGTLYPFETRLDAAKAALPYEMAKPIAPPAANLGGEMIPMVERLRIYARRDAIEASKNKLVELKQPVGRDEPPSQI